MTMRRIRDSLHVLCLLVVGTITSVADERPAQLKALQPGVSITLVAEHPDLATPTGIDVDKQGRIWVVATHTHFRPDDYVGPEHDEVLVFSDVDGDGRANQRQVFYNATDATMDLELGPDGWVYLAERDRILRIRDTDGNGSADVEELVMHLETEADYPHNGLEGLSWHPNGDLVFGLGENFATAWTLTGTDDSKVSGSGEGGIFRCSADGGQLHRIAHGFWNPFGICVREDGEIFAGENDPGERPPCRLLHVVEGGDYGYQRAYGSEAHHPFVAWNGELRGTLPMIHPSGEAPCGVTPLGRGLLVPSWSDHRIDFFRLRRKGASYDADRIELVKGGRYFRPGCIAADPNATGNKRVWYLTDWVDGGYAAHGFGRLWKLELDLEAADWTGPLAPEPLTEDARLARSLRIDNVDFSADALLPLCRNNDPFVARAALVALSLQITNWKPSEISHWAAEDRVSAVLSLKIADSAPGPWIAQLLADESDDVQFETLRWMADANLATFLPYISQYLTRGDLDYRRFEAAVATWNTLNGKPEAGVRDTELLLTRVQDPNANPRLRSYALRLLPTHALKATMDAPHRTRTLPPGLTLELLKQLLSLKDELLSLEVIRTLAADPQAAEAILASVAADQKQIGVVRAEAIAALAPVVSDQLELFIALAADEQGSLREEALRCLRSASITATQRNELRHISGRYAESADAFYATRHPKSFADARPALTDTQGWLDAVNAIASPEDREAGRRIFHQSQLVRCANCHRHEGRGNVVGPDLSNVSRGLNRLQLLKSILEPSSQMAPEYQPRTVILKDGRTFTGIRLRSYTSEVMRDADGQNLSFNRDDIESMIESPVSFMPVGLANQLTLRELRDLLAFLERR